MRNGKHHAKRGKHRSKLCKKTINTVENYIENRVRMFAFSVNSSRVSDSLEFHNNRIKDFFKFDGSLECYNVLLSRNVIPNVWDKIIQLGLKSNP